MHPQGEFSKRDVDTQIKERPTIKDIENMNKVIEVLIIIIIILFLLLLLLLLLLL